MGPDQILNKVLADTIGMTRNEEEEDEKENNAANNVEEKQKEQVNVAPGELGRTQEIVPGVSGILAPVEDVTAFVAAYTKEKLAPVDAAKKITDLTYENKQKNAYIEKLQRAVDEAMQRGDKNVMMPSIPRELLQTLTTKKDNTGGGEEDLEDSKFMRDSLRLITQHEMLIKAQDRISGSSNKKEPNDWIEITYHDGTTFKGPSHLAPQPIQQQPQNTELKEILSALVERMSAMEQANANPYNNQPQIRLPTGEKDQDGEPIYADIPIDYAMRLGMLSPQQPRTNEGPDERTLTTLERIAEKIGTTPTMESLIEQIEAREERDERKMEREMMRMEKWKAIFNPTPTRPNPDTGIDETAVRTAEIQARTAVEKAKIEKESKTLDLIKSALEPDPTLVQRQQPKKSDRQIGRDFLLNVQEQARREGVPL